LVAGDFGQKFQLPTSTWNTHCAGYMLAASPKFDANTSNWKAAGYNCRLAMRSALKILLCDAVEAARAE